MTPSNFNWFLYVMLFLYIRLLIEKQANEANSLVKRMRKVKKKKMTQVIILTNLYL
jgi:hypothetical protein